MKSVLPVLGGYHLRDRAQRKQAVRAQINAAGPGDRPNPPRSLIAQPGARKVLLTWEGPQRMDNVTGWRIYKDVESNLIQEISDPNTFQANVLLTAGTLPPVVNIFVSAVNPNAESVKVQVRCSPTPEAGAPVDPNPPEGWRPPRSTLGPGGGTS